MTARVKDGVYSILGWRPVWPWEEKPRAAEEPSVARSTAVASDTGSSIEVVRPRQDSRDVAGALEDRLKRRGFAVGSALGAAPTKSQSPPGSWESETQNSLSAWTFHFVPLYSGPDARPIAGVIGRDWRPPKRVRLHFDYQLEGEQRGANVVRFNATLIDVDAGTVIGNMAFSGNRSLDSVVSDVASLVPRRLR